jgi:hypothetical protein
MMDIERFNERLRALTGEAIANAVGILIDHGATEAEVTEFLRWHIPQLEADRKHALAAFERFVSEPDAPSHGLQ